MKVNVNVRIDRPVDDVWQVLADDFTEIHKWASFVKDSYALTGSEPVQGCDVSGRVCQLSDDPNGLQAHERIVGYDKSSYRLDVAVEIKNAPALLPIKSNLAVFRLKALGPDTTEASIEANPVLKPHGYVMYPMLAVGLKKNFGDLLKQMKAHCETLPAKAA